MGNWDRRTIFKSATILLFWGAFLGLFLPFLAEILLAAVFALAMAPFLARFLDRRHFRWRTSVALMLLGMFVLLAVPFSVVVYKLYATVGEISRNGLQNAPAFQKLLLFRSQFVDLANRFLTSVGLHDVDIAGMSEEALSRGANAVLKMVTGFVYSVPNMLLSLFVFCAALYFLLAEAGTLKALFHRQRLLSGPEAVRFLAILQKSCYNTVVSSMLIAVLQASIIALGAWALGAGDFTVVWAVTFFCSFVPVIGAGPVALALALGQLVMGDWGKAAGLVGIAVLGGTLDNIVRPYLISSGEEDLHPVVGLLAIIGALLLFGMPGLFLGPVIATVAVKIVPTFGGNGGADLDSEKNPLLKRET